MNMTPGLRKFALTAHVTSSVGWLGAVAGFLTLAVAGLTSQDPQTVRAAYLAMELTAWFIIVPLSLASPLTGLVQSLGTAWGLFRHYWVVVKFLITIPATVVLLVHMQPIGHLARAVAETTLASGALAGLRIQLVADAGAAVVVLLVATTLSVYKPRGLTPYGRRKQLEAALPVTHRDLSELAVVHDTAPLPGDYRTAARKSKHLGEPTVGNNGFGRIPQCFDLDHRSVLPGDIGSLVATRHHG